MPKTEKIEKVKELTERFRSANGAMFADFRGLTVKDATELRRSLRGAEATLTVSKNTLARIAVREAGIEDAMSLLEGPTAITFLSGDPLAGAKTVLEMGRRFPALVVKGALIEGRVLGADDARSLATIDTKEISVGKVAGMLQAPIARIIYLLQAPLQRIAYALAERARQGQAEGAEAPAEAAADTPAEPAEPAEVPAEGPQEEPPAAEAEATAADEA
jgi:large subunit ribosomal protein L10